MTLLDVWIVLGIIVATLVLFATERLRADVVSVLVLTALMVMGLFRETFPTPDECLTGFSNQATITVGAMFVLSAGLVRTGAIDWLSRRIIRAGGHSGNRVFVLLMLAVGVMSAFVNNTAALAVFLPIALAISRDYQISPSKILMPLSFTCMLGGTCTLIGSSTNILVSEISREHGDGAFPMFELGKLGVVFFFLGLLYLVFVARRMLPTREPVAGLTRKYRLSAYLTSIFVNEGSPLIGRTPADARLSERYDVNVLQITRAGQARWFGLRDTRLQEGDRLLVRGEVKDILRLKEAEGLSTIAEVKFADEDLSSETTALAEAVISSRSALVGKSLKEADFRHKYGVFALAVRKHGRTIRRKIADIRLEVGDTLLLQGRRGLMDTLRDDPDFIVLEELEMPSARRKRAAVSISIVVLVVTLAAVGLVPIVLSALAGCALMIVTGCLTVKDAYESVDWMVILLLAGLIPLGIAMEKTGTASFLVDGVLRFAGATGPVGVVSALYALAAALTAVMSNNATAILLAPIGIGTAQQLGLSPWPFLMAITFGASAAFATPVGYQTNLMVYSPGGYRYADFLRVGLPLNLVFWVVATWGIPRIWGF